VVFESVVILTIHHTTPKKALREPGLVAEDKKEMKRRNRSFEAI
jgi:hypothetical protein